MPRPTVDPRRRNLVASRAVIRWAWRLFRREWRQQFLMLYLVAVAVAVAIGSTTVLYNLAPPNEGRFGDAGARVSLVAFGPQSLAEDLALIEEQVGTVDVIGHRYLPVPGTTDRVELRSQDPRGPYGATMLRLQEGRYPAASTEVAVTAGIATALGVGLGGSLSLADAQWTVVGLVENPHDLQDEFALLAPDQADHHEIATVLLDARSSQLAAIREALGNRAIVELPPDAPLSAALAMMLLTAVTMLLVCLLAGASFVVIAQRRLRQLGVLAAIGATRRQVRLVTLANGAAIGLVATTLGTGFALVIWFLLGSQLEPLAGHRIALTNIPWWTVVTSTVLALLTATLAAWWPARSLVRLPVMQALSGRPPRLRPARHAGMVSAVILALGVVLLTMSNRARPGPDNDWVSGAFWQPGLVVGTVATIIGFLFISPLAIRLIGIVGSRAPVAIRLALRDLDRYRARSTAALAALTLALTVTVFVVVTAAAVAPGDDEGNLSDSQMLVWIGAAPQAGYVPERTPAQIDMLATQVGELAAGLGASTVLPLQMAVEPDIRPEPGRDGTEGGRPAVAAAWFDEYGRTLAEPLYVATPELLAYHGVEPQALAGGTEVLTMHRRELHFLTAQGDEPGTAARSALFTGPRHTSVPQSLITVEELRRRGWRAESVGWLVVADGTLSGDRVEAARATAARAGLSVEVREDDADLRTVGWVMTGIAAIIALGILAAAVGLVRGEAARDLRILAATGATHRARRTLTAVTAGALALAGAVLATACAYLLAGPLNPNADLSNVPVAQLALVVVGIPLVATVAGWLLSGREPPVLARAVLE